MDALSGPPFPERLGYLWEIFERLDAMRSVGLNGLERFTPTHIRDGAALFDWTLAPHEVEALVALDLVTLYPSGGEETPDTGEPKRAAVPDWPAPKE